MISRTEGKEEDWICRKRHPFYKEKALRSVKQQLRAPGYVGRIPVKTVR